MSGHYYYAGGKRHALTPDGTRWAVDLPLARSRGIDVPTADEGTELTGNLVMLPRARVAKNEGALRSIGALQTVYSTGDITSVPLPEVRIEVDDSKQHEAALKALSSADVAADIITVTDGMIVVRPKSGLGDQALELAAHIYEEAQPAAASARMVQIKRRPDVHPSRVTAQPTTRGKVTRR